MRKPIVTLDGPAGAGKSTVARRVAERLGLRFLDTGAMYRAVTWAALDRGVDLHDAAALAALARGLKLALEGGRVAVDGRDVTTEIRDERVTAASRHIADPPEVRAELVRLQREFGRDGGIVTEGRDQGSVVFPDAEHKFYLDASIDERARRRFEELTARGESPDFEGLRRAIAERDARDKARKTGGLVVPAGAVVIDTSGLTVEEVVEAIARRIAS